MAGYGQAVATVQLRPIRADDLAALGVRPQEDDPFGFFGHRAVNGLERRFAVDGLISDDVGGLAVQTPDGTLLGSMDWFAVRHGPSSTARALNIGIFLLPEHRGRSYGSAAPRRLRRLPVRQHTGRAPRSGHRRGQHRRAAGA